MSHTPGPWVAVTLDSEKDPVEVHRRMLSFGCGPVFLVHAPEHPGATPDFAIFIATVGNGPTSAINARLIAAAPELLEALNDLLVWADWHSDRHRSVSMDEPNTGALEKARAAIRRGGA